MVLIFSKTRLQAASQLKLTGLQDFQKTKSAGLMLSPGQDQACGRPSALLKDTQTYVQH